MKEEITLDSIYAKEIFRLAENVTDKIFYNSSTEHAVIVHQALMKTAKQYVDIFSCSMCSEISNNEDYLNYMKDFLNGGKDRKINILLTNYDENFSSMPVYKLLSDYPEQVAIKKFTGIVNYQGKPAHFTVSDDRAFRLETDIEKHMAFGNFNSEVSAKNLREVFDKMFNSELATNV